MDTMLKNVVRYIMKITVNKKGQLTMFFDQRATPDIVDFFVRNVTISVTNQRKEELYKNPLVLISKTAHLQKIVLEINREIPMGDQPAKKTDIPIQPGNFVQFLRKAVPLENRIVIHAA